jgi:type II secretory pathway component HofQ
MRTSHAVVVALVLACSSAGAEPTRAAKRISLDVVKAPVGDVLRMLADVGRLNLVLSDDVGGSVTLTLRDVPWPQVLDTVLAARGLGKEVRGNILRVAPLKVLQEEAEAHARLAQAREAAAPLRTWLIPLSHARAADMLPHVQALLSPRGRVSVDARTNTLIVTDVQPPALP